MVVISICEIGITGPIRRFSIFVARLCSTTRPSFHNLGTNVARRLRTNPIFLPSWYQVLSTATFHGDGKRPQIGSRSTQRNVK